MIEAIRVLAKEFNLDAQALQNMTIGVLERLRQFGAEKLLAMNEVDQSIILKAAVINWYEAQQKMAREYMNDPVKKRELQDEVYKLLKEVH